MARWHRHTGYLVGWSALLLALVAPATAQAGTQYFPQTDLSVSGTFLTFWRNQGGLAVFGYPVSPQADERNRDTNQVYPTQWFERNRFEAHPENNAPYNVLLGRLGDDRLRQLGIDWKSRPHDAGPKNGCLWFRETSFNVCDQGNGLGFRSYWQRNGLHDPRLDRYNQSLALFGFPLTEARTETNASGDTVLTQWFERARFEWHPSNPDQFKVLLGLLGDEAGNYQAPLTQPTWSEPFDQGDGTFQTQGVYTNERGQEFGVTVTSQNGQAIKRYTDQLRLHFEAIQPQTQLQTSEANATSNVGNAILTGAMGDPQRSLVIDVFFSPNENEFGHGYTVRFAIDPEIAQGAVHDYRKRCQMFITARLDMRRGAGSTDGTIMQNGVANATRTAPDGNNNKLISLPFSPTSWTTYDLVIQGRGGPAGNLGANRYKISGSWDYGYGDLPPSGGDC